MKNITKILMMMAMLVMPLFAELRDAGVGISEMGVLDSKLPEISIIYPSDGDYLSPETAIQLDYTILEDTELSPVLLAMFADDAHQSEFDEQFANGETNWTVPNINSDNVFLQMTATDYYGNVGSGNSGVFGIGNPFEIVSATTGNPICQAGVDIADILILTQSIGGASDNLSLELVFTSSTQWYYTTNSENFSISSGEQTQINISWPVPMNEGAFDYSMTVNLRENNEIIHSMEFPNFITATQLDSETIEEFEEQVAECIPLPPGSACALSMISLVPYAGAVANTQLYLNSACEMGIRWEDGDYLGAGVAALGGVLIAVDGFLDVAAPYTPLWALSNAISVSMGCADDIIYNYGDLRSVDLDSLASKFKLIFDEYQPDYSNELFLSGNATFRIGFDGSWTTADSLGLTSTFVFGDSLKTHQWANVGANPVPLGTEETNENSEINIEIHSNETGMIEFGFLHRTESDEVLWLHYQPFDATETTIGYLTVSNQSSNFALALGFNGDGNIDEEISPTPQLGDVNFDGVVNVQDVILAVNFALNIEEPTAEQFTAADINEDGVINVFDVIQIVNVVLQID